MYEIDEKDKVLALDLPTPDSSADPLPIVLAKSGAVILSYKAFVARKDVNILVSFPKSAAHYFGPPNVEVFASHPLSARGLKPCGAYEVKESSWIRALERRASTHKMHDKARYMATWKHYVFTFRDSVFECVATDYGYEMNHQDDDTVRLMALRLYK